jgi:hypothetical protein
MGSHPSLSCLYFCEVFCSYESFPQKFGEIIGRGGNGVVVKGINIETGDFAAIKQIDKELISEDKLPGLRVQYQPNTNTHKYT